MKVSLIGFILNEPRMRSKFSDILEDEGKPVAADIALDYMIQEYVNLRLGGTSKVVGETSFPDREFKINCSTETMATPTRDPILQALINKWHNTPAVILSLQEFARPMNSFFVKNVNVKRRIKIPFRAWSGSALAPEFLPIGGACGRWRWLNSDTTAGVWGHVWWSGGR
jgi:hypothetical protein